ncbi:TM2 domain-containing protein [Brachyspira hyodysenteriae]|uniref:TM2 domain-containing protein n=1 Tax=Brachyspira hyodysenteriae TaxID=159 RepID=UPI002B2596A7|nr:TM2 domain-containing protein [Brachyspira hyodysenteriae]WPC23831.1 TM2 domain-containing protein [Brachyspira hyodysenteriae]
MLEENNSQSNQTNENTVSMDKQADEQFCSSCGKAIKIKAELCPHCGVRQNSNLGEKSKKSWGTSLLLCIFLGMLGIHRFYAGKIISAIVILITTLFIFIVLPIITLGIGIIFWFIPPLIELIDIIIIVTGKLKDSEGKYITKD